MFKEILQIIPKITPSDAAKMESQLVRRFKRVSAAFGKGMVGALTGGGIAGAALGLIDKILNPLKETQDAINKTLAQSDDLVTYAKQFGTTAGRLARLTALGKSTGLDESQLYMLIEKFQATVAEAVADPNKPTSVRNFVGQKDTAEAFFEFIQALQRMEKNQQILVQQEVFGEKQILRMSDFLNTDFAAQSKALGGPTAEQLTPRLEKLGDLNDYRDVLEASRGLKDAYRKGGVISKAMVDMENERAKLDLQRENSQIQSYKDLAAISNAANEIVNLGKEAILGVTSLVVKVTDLTNNVRKLTESRAMKGIMKWIGGN